MNVSVPVYSDVEPLCWKTDTTPLVSTIIKPTSPEPFDVAVVPLSACAGRMSDGSVPRFFHVQLESTLVLTLTETTSPERDAPPSVSVTVFFDGFNRVYVI